MEWRCSVCGELVSDDDMVGYFTDRDGKYIPGSLGFWHRNERCGRKDLHFSGIQLPKDTHVGSFKERMPQIIALHIYEADTDEFRRDCATFLLRCFVDGYDEAYPHINDAKCAGVVESNLPDNLLWDNEVRAVLKWKQNSED